MAVARFLSLKAISTCISTYYVKGGMDNLFVRAFHSDSPLRLSLRQHQLQFFMTWYHAELRFLDNVYTDKYFHTFQEAAAVLAEMFQMQPFTDIKISVGQ
jgi:hypothetical protein